LEPTNADVTAGDVDDAPVAGGAAAGTVVTGDEGAALMVAVADVHDAVAIVPGTDDERRPR
jgi:hypothetical protein